MMIKKIAISVVSLLTSIHILGCSDTKDYWTMDPPDFVIYNPQGQAELITKSSDVTKGGVIAHYGSHMLFKEINSDVKFSISAECSVDGQIFKKETHKQKIYQKLFFYNYIPEEVLATADGHQDNDFLCNFDIIAANSVNSKVEYRIPNLIMNTVLPYKISIGSPYKMGHSENSGYLAKGYIDVSNQGNKDASASLDEVNKLFEDVAIFCNPQKFENNRYVTGNKEISLYQFFAGQSVSHDLFYKKCRVIGTISSYNHDETNINVKTADHEKVWSPYFDVVTHKPDIKIQPSFINSSQQYFTDNPESYSFEFAKLDISIRSYYPTFVRFKKSIDVKVGIGFNDPMYRGFGAGPASFTDRSRISIAKDGVPNAFLSPLTTKLRFTDESGNPVELLDLSSGDSHNVYLQLEKNFNCTVYKRKEMGFLLQGIEPKSEEDEIEVYILINNKLEKLPSIYYLSDIIQPSTLNLRSNSNYVLDTLVLPRLASNSFRNIERHDMVYQAKIQRAFNTMGAKDFSKFLRSVPNGKLKASKFCRAY